MFNITFIAVVVPFLFMCSLSANATTCVTLSLEETNTFLDIKPHLKKDFVNAYSEPGILVSLDLKPYLGPNEGSSVVSLALKPHLGPNIVSFKGESISAAVYYDNFKFYVCTSSKGWANYIGGSNRSEGGQETVFINASLDTEVRFMEEILRGLPSGERGNVKIIKSNPESGTNNKPKPESGKNNFF